MPPIFPMVPRRLLVALIILAVLALAIPARLLLTRVAGAAIAHEATGRGMRASWRTLALTFPAGIRTTGFTLVAEGGDTLLTADSLAVDLAPGSLLLFRPRVQAVTLAHARAVAPRRATADPDTLGPAEEEEARSDALRRAAPRVIRAAESLVRALLLPARRMPRLSWRDVTLEARAGDADEPPRSLVLRWLELTPRGGGITLAGEGALEAGASTPFEWRAAYGADDRLTGGARVLVRDPSGGPPTPLTISVSGHVTQDRRAHTVRIGEAMNVTIGTIPFRVAGSAALAGPLFSFRLEADSLTDERLRASLPPAVMGPLADVTARGSWDYRLGLDLDLAHPDSVRFDADVIPKGLALDPAGTRLQLFGLDQPFIAPIHLPKGRIEFREMSEANPHFVTLDRMDSLLVCAVLANEDGGFYRHRGFSEDAVKGAIADNLVAGAFRRGAGTITMQLARNLYLGHERTLARKGQEVILAWVLEHLTGVSKRRLLEIYLNIIEWGPDVQGADEAARYYFGRDARRLSLDESLFLTIVIPSPARWRNRFDDQGALRPFARAQMHFIGRAMVKKGWLRAEELPETDQLGIRLDGRARDVLYPPDSTAADSTSAEPRGWLRFPWSPRR